MYVLNTGLFCAIITLFTLTISVRCTLELIQIIWRHGDRTPNNLFPTDVNNPYWLPLGFGELTNIGKEQHFELGQYIRQRYAGFLNTSYNHEEILINSTTVDRALMSAYCNLAGLYPPEGVQVWNENIPWQPIPVHTRPEAIDYIVDTFTYCPKYDLLHDAVAQSPPVQELNAENADLFAFVTNQTGYPVTDIYSMSDVYDTLLCDKSHNFSVPSWVDPLWDQMAYLQDMKMYYEYGLPPLYRLTGGPLLGHMINNMNLKINGQIDKRRAFIYSSHDTSIVALLSALGVWDLIAPPYAATVFVELQKLSDGTHGVQIFYRNDSSVDPYELIIPSCGSPCPIDVLIAQTADIIPDDIVKECTLIEPTEYSFWSWLKELLGLD